MSDDGPLDDVDPEGLSPRQAAFCREYLIDLNGTQAAIRAGYAKAGARTQAVRLLANDDIAADIARRKRDRALRTGIDADRVLAQIARLAFSDIRCIVSGHGALERVERLDDDAAAALVSVKVSARPSGEYDDENRPIYEDVVEYKMADKRGALDLLGKHLDLWTVPEKEGESVADVLRDIAGKLPD